MKKLLAILVLATAFVGCQTESVYCYLPNDSRVTIERKVSRRINVENIVFSHGEETQTPSDYLTMQVNVASIWSQPVALEYQVIWFDKNGIEIPSITSVWKSQMVQPHEVHALKAVAPRLDAADFRLYIRSAKR